MMKADDFLDAPSADSFLDGAAPAQSGGAAFGIYPKQRATPSRPETKEAAKKGAEALASGMETLGFFPPSEKKPFDVGRVGTATELGAGAGFAGPKALEMVGKGMGYVPYAPVKAAGKGVEALGKAFGTTPALTRTAGGALGFGAADVGGQVAEKMGLPAAVGMGAGAKAIERFPEAAKGAVRGVLGAPSATSEQYARAAEDLGFKLSPSQVRQDVPVSAKGATGWAEKNQTLANRLASGATGVEAKEISPDFIRGRLKDLGKEFDKVYKGKDFVIDPQAADSIRQIASNEMQLPANASVSAVRNTANNIIQNFNSLTSRVGAKPGTFAIEGDALQRLRTDLLQAARSTSSRQDAHAIYELVDVIDQSVARNHPEIAEKLTELRPMYRNTVILEDLNRAGGINQGNISLERLGNMLGSRKGGVRTGDRADIDQLGEMGRQLRLRARWEPEGKTASPTEEGLGKILGLGTDLAGTLTGARSRYARALQRKAQGEE
jgi:hypothetical protein